MLPKKTHRDGWTLQESTLHINFLELKAVNLTLLTFQKIFLLKAVVYQMDNQWTTILMRMGWTCSIWEKTVMAK